MMFYKVQTSKIVKWLSCARATFWFAVLDNHELQNLEKVKNSFE